MITQDLNLEDYRALAEFRHRIRTYLSSIEQEARTMGLEPRQHQLLLAIKGFGQHGDEGHGLTIGEIADHLKLRHHSAVELVDRTEHGGLVERVRARADRRQVFVRLTAKGENALQRLSVCHLEEIRSTGPALVRALNELRSSIGDERLVPPSDFDSDKQDE